MPPIVSENQNRYPKNAFSYHEFRWLYASNMAFFLGIGSQGVVRAWLAFKLTGSEFALGLVTFASALPILLISPFGGVLADRMDRRRLIAWGQAAVVIGESFMLILIITDRLVFWHLLVIAILMGMVYPLIMPARNAIVVNIVGKSGLSNAMGLHMAGLNTTRILGPAVAGFLIDTSGVSATYAMSVLLYLSGLLFLLPLHACPPSEEGPKGSMASSMVEGAVYVGRYRLLLVLIVFGLVPVFLAMPVQNLLVVFAEKVWMTGSRGLGLLSAASGLGGVAGSVWVATRGSGRSQLLSMMVAVICFGTALVGFALSPWFSIGLVSLFLANVAAAVFTTINNTTVQYLIPDRVRGRVSSFLMMSFSLPLLGTLPLSALAGIFGAPVTIGAAAVTMVGIAVIFYLFSGELRGMDDRIHAALSIPHGDSRP